MSLATGPFTDLLLPLLVPTVCLFRTLLNMFTLLDDQQIACVVSWGTKSCSKFILLCGTRDGSYMVY